MHNLELTQFEALFLSDQLSWYDEREQLELVHSVLEKVIYAVHSTMNQSPTVTLFSLEELWYLRDHIKSHAQYGNEKVGLNLLLKIAEGITSLDSGMKEVVEQFGESPLAEPNKSTYYNKLKELGKGKEE